MYQLLAGTTDITTVWPVLPDRTPNVTAVWPVIPNVKDAQRGHRIQQLPGQDT
jgi:hypothetical protein